MVNKADRDPHHHTQKMYPLQDVMGRLGKTLERSTNGN